MVFCSKCGYKNNDSNDKCEKCGEFLLKHEFFEAKSDEKFEEIFTEENLNALCELTVEDYNNIIENITKMGHYNLAKFIETQNIDVKNLSTLDKISILAISYSKIGYKSKGAELGSYSFNNILVDDRLFDSNKISTLIHELSHHIFSEIFEQVLMYVWECKKSDAIEALAWFTLITNPLTNLSNEYCAHTCEGRFIPFGYQNYGSFNKILNENFNPEKDQKAVTLALVFGNTISTDIINILETFIDINLREEIKEQFKNDYTIPPNYEQILLESKEIMPDEDKINNITTILTSGFKAAQEKNAHEILESFKETFENFDIN